jgi:hypothetical protein
MHHIQCTGFHQAELLLAWMTSGPRIRRWHRHPVPPILVANAQGASGTILAADATHSYTIWQIVVSSQAPYTQPVAIISTYGGQSKNVTLSLTQGNLNPILPNTGVPWLFGDKNTPVTFTAPAFVYITVNYQAIPAP